jgi:hypothetical protein
VIAVGHWDPSRPPSEHPEALGRPGGYVPGPDGAPVGRRFDGYMDEPHTGSQYVRSFKTAKRRALEMCDERGAA